MGGVKSVLTTDKKKELIVLSGQVDSGKTTLFYRLLVNDIPSDNKYIPTMGYNSDTWQPTESKSYILWDFGGRPETQCLSLELGKYFPIEAIFHIIRLKNESEILTMQFAESDFCKSTKYDYDQSIEALKTLALTPGYRYAKLYVFLNYEEDFLRTFILNRTRTEGNNKNQQGAEEETIDPKVYTATKKTLVSIFNEIIDLDRFPQSVKKIIPFNILNGDQSELKKELKEDFYTFTSRLFGENN